MNGYPPIELGQPGKPACPDQFNEQSTLLCKDCVKFYLQTSLSAVYVQLGTIEVAGSKAGGLGNVQWGPEEPYLPVQGSFARKFDAIRVRNLTPGDAAQVFITVTPAGG